MAAADAPTADPAAVTSAVLDDTLGRLSKKAGVKATILIDRATGTILKIDGQAAALRTAATTSGRKNKGTTATTANTTTAGNSTSSDTLVDTATMIANDGEDTATAADLNTPAANVAAVDETRGARELARLVWNYVRTSGELVETLDTEDELRLLRLRTKKQELVIVPDPKYLLVVVHDTPPA